MLKRYWLGCIFLVFSCYTPERNCEPFQTGTFTFESIVNNTIETTTFYRSPSIEIEHYKGAIDSASIRWVNPCECILTKINPKNNQEKRPLKIKILKTTADTYTFEYSFVNQPGSSQRGKATKISDAWKP
ncbi:MAG: DNA topoisomerase IV [Flavobacteriaceae bacterium]